MSECGPECQVVLTDELFARLKTSIESGTISFPPGLTREQRREFLRNRLRDNTPTEEEPLMSQEPDNQGPELSKCDEYSNLLAYERNRRIWTVVSLHNYNTFSMCYSGWAYLPPPPVTIS